MTFRIKSLSAAAIAVVLAFGAASCSSTDEPTTPATAGDTTSEQTTEQAPPEGAAQEGGEAIFAGFISSPADWNPLSAQGDTTGNRQAQWPFYPHVFYGAYDGALTLNTDLMESAEMTSTDPMTIVYKIRPEAVWSDGEPIDGDDFLYTWSVQDPRQCPDCTAAWQSGYDSMTLTVSDDKKTVTAVFEAPFNQWRTLFIYLLPAHIAEQHGSLADSFNDWFVNNQPTISGGPYVIEEWNKDVSLTMVKNPLWYGSPAHLDTIHYRYITSPTEVITAYENGEVTIVYQNPSLEVTERAALIPDAQVSIRPGLTYYHLIFKIKDAPVSDIILRQAMARAINADDIVTRVVRQYDPGAATLRSLAFAPGQKVPGYDGDPYVDTSKAANIGHGDVEGAKKLLTDNGYTIVDGKLIDPTGEPVRPLSILTYAVDNERMQMAEIVNSQLKEIGIETTIDAADRSRYGTAGFAGEFDILVTATASDLGVQALDQWYGTGKARNGSGYSDPDFDALVAQGNVELDPAEQVRILQEMDAKLQNDAVALPLYSIGNLLITSTKFTGIEPSMSKYGITWAINEWAFTS